MNLPSRILRTSLLSVALLVCGATGCASHYIPNTDVEDNDENRQIINFCEKYRHAVELKDIGILLKMASKKYYEDGGNVDSSDDIDYAGLAEYLHKKFLTASAIRYEMRYRAISREADVIHVDYTYVASYRIPGSKNSQGVVIDEWRHKVEDNRLDIVRNQDNFLILAGM